MSKSQLLITWIKLVAWGPVVWVVLGCSRGAPKNPSPFGDPGIQTTSLPVVHWLKKSSFKHLQTNSHLLTLSKKSPTGPTERTPKPEYPIALNNLLRGPLVRSHSIFDGLCHHLLVKRKDSLTAEIPTTHPISHTTQIRIRSGEWEWLPLDPTNPLEKLKVFGPQTMGEIEP